MSKRFAVTIRREVYHIQTVVVEADDYDSAHDAALEKVEKLDTANSTFWKLGQSDSVVAVYDDAGMKAKCVFGFE